MEGGGGGILYVPSDKLWLVRVSILKYGIIFGLLVTVIISASFLSFFSY